MNSEDQLEAQCITWFTQQGYEYQNGYAIAPNGSTPERDDYYQVVLKQRLLHQLARINPELPQEALENVVQTLCAIQGPSLTHTNQIFHRYLVEGVPVEYSQAVAGEPKTCHTHAQLMDFFNLENNAFLVVNQFAVTGTPRSHRPDMVIFINGLPLAVIELKSPADEKTDIWEAYSQLQTYKKHISDLLIYNEALIISDGPNARLGSLTAHQERFMPWRTLGSEEEQPSDQLAIQTLIQGFFRQDLLLDYLRYFILFEQEQGTLVKKMAGYHQFHAVRAAVQATVRAANPQAAPSHLPRVDRIEPGSGKAGVIWHTQGSGKSIEMLCYASKLVQQAVMKNPTLVIVTDRNDLDGQLFNTFDSAQESLKQIPQQAEDRASLRQMLQQRQSGGIIFTTIQKFARLDGETCHPSLSNRHNIVVISDEAHRSQYVGTPSLRAIKDAAGTVIGHKVRESYAQSLREALPHASFLGFTGTPIALSDKDTRQVFGDYVSIYDIQDAVNDGATVPIVYESRLAKLTINQTDIDDLNDQIETEIGIDETIADREKIKSQWSALEKLIGAKPRVDQIARDLVEHFTIRTQTFSGKAMIVAMSRAICVDLYNAIVTIKPEWHHPDPDKGMIKVVMTGSASDPQAMQPHIHTKRTREHFEKRFKDPNDGLELVIVRDMWLTGFDAPCCHTLYVDKPMHGHNLMQAIARVNRVFKDKPGGLVVDYIGIANALKQAVKTYINSQGKGQIAPSITQSFGILLEKIDIIRDLFATPVDGQCFHYRPNFKTQALYLLPKAINHLSGLASFHQAGHRQRDGKRRFLDTMAALIKAYSLCNNSDSAKAYRDEIAFYSLIKTTFIKCATVDKKRTDALRNSALKLILDNAVVAQGVDDIFSLVGLKKPNIGLLSDAFLEDVQQMKEKNLAVELLEKLLRDAVKSRMKNDVVQEKSYSERIQSTLNKYHNRTIETAQVIEELIQWAKDMQKDDELREQWNLSVAEMAFYRALIDNEASVRQLGNDNLRALAIELTRQLRQSVTVDWHKRDSVRARMRNIVRRLLRRWKYPPDQCEAALKLVLEQASALANSEALQPESG